MHCRNIEALCHKDDSGCLFSAGSFFKSSRANLWLGRILGSLQMTSYSAWHKNHNIDHHMNLAKDVRISPCFVCFVSLISN